MNETEIHDEVIRLLPARKGHFRLESGHHGALWFDLELLCRHPEPVRRLAAQIASRLAAHKAEVICGPLVEGAFVALMVALEMGIPFSYAEQSVERDSTDRESQLYPVQYRVPRALRSIVRGKRAAIVNDVINAGSAIRGTFSDLEACGAEPVAIAALAVLGQSAAKFAADQNVSLEAIAFLPNEIWIPADCPLCARGVPLEEPVGSKAKGAHSKNTNAGVA
jgi:orotate phosphoribosyltransferase